MLVCRPDSIFRVVTCCEAVQTKIEDVVMREGEVEVECSIRRGEPSFIPSPHSFEFGLLSQDHRVDPHKPYVSSSSTQSRGNCYRKSVLPASSTDTHFVSQNNISTMWRRHDFPIQIDLMNNFASSANPIPFQSPAPLTPFPRPQPQTSSPPYSHS